MRTNNWLRTRGAASGKWSLTRSSARRVVGLGLSLISICYLLWLVGGSRRSNFVSEQTALEATPGRPSIGIQTDLTDLALLLSGDSPVIDIKKHLDSCTGDPSGNFHRAILEPRLRKGSKVEPASVGNFVCEAQCALIEPELEYSLKYLGGSVTKYTASSVANLCRKNRVPLLVRIRDGRAQWTICGTEKLKATHLWFVVRRTIFTLTRLVQIPDVVFAFDNSDYSRPFSEDPHGLSWLWTVPGVVRFVGDSSHPALLWPTSPYVKTTAYCQIDADGIADRPGSVPHWLKPGGCDRSGNLDWKQKREEVFWRGSPTGYPIDDDHVQFMPRSMFNKQFANRPGYDVAFLKEAIPPYANAKFMSSHKWDEGVSREDFAKYKMIVSLDGHTASWGLIERLGIGSLLLVHESLKGYREFYYALLKPFVHYLPISFDFTNLDNIRRWVLTTPEGDEHARGIAQEARNLIKQRMRPEDMWCYLYRMLTTLSTKQAFKVDDPEFATFTWYDITEASVQAYSKSPM